MTRASSLPYYDHSELALLARSGTWPPDLCVTVMEDGSAEGPIPADFPTIVLAIGHHAAQADLCVDMSLAERVLDRIHANPQASLILCQLLRMTEAIPIPAALLAESLAYASLQAGPEHQHWQSQLIRKPPARQSGPVLLHQAYEDHDHLILNRPARANMINMQLRQELTATLGALDLAQDPRPILITGRGRWFCAGGDLHEFGLVSSPDQGHVLRMRAHLPAAVARVSERLHMHLHGEVIGAGLELAAFASHVSAHPQTRFRLPESAMGTIPGCGGTVSLTRRIGRQKLALMCLADLTLNADQALDWGLIDQISDQPPSGRALHQGFAQGAAQ